jgi:hypothetical protein
MSFCVKCGAVRAAEAAFCSHCGHLVNRAWDSSQLPLTPVVECPTCRTVLNAAPKFCKRCGYAFGSRSEVRPQMLETPKRPSRVIGYALLPVAAALILAGAMGHYYSSDAWRAHVQALRDKQGFGPEPNWAEIQRRDEAAASEIRPQRDSTKSGGQTQIGIGESATVRSAYGFWPCGSNPEAFSELMKWAVRGDNPEVKRTMRATRSFGLVGGMRVKILDVGFGRRRVRVLTNSAGEAYLKDEEGSFAADPRIGRECWVVSEALVR